MTLAQFVPKRNRSGPIALVFVATAVLGAMIFFGTRPGVLNPSATASSAKPTAPRTTPVLPTGGDFATSIRFESDRVAGVFDINDSFWESSTLVVDVTVSVERGSLDYQFLAMDMASGDVTMPDVPSEPSDLRGGIITAGGEDTGTIRFTKNHGDTQILLGEAGGRNLTMLAVKG